MSQSSAAPHDDHRNWLDNCLPLVQETGPMFADVEDASSLYSIEQALKQSDTAKLKELDAVRDRLRGALR